ncbi:hypothetical protein SKAU_G00282320 [Synaphobranchus kaupii]|uniref:Uncharacterized protein n=1 Tax=Synaphobranchus kaupii TaxID=118154 RepID=A0A9Q1EXB9_SYNKA|nr:hypothetical protein SKAU_G00282320 [Synaphobranchus kaupii]
MSPRNIPHAFQNRLKRLIPQAEAPDPDLGPRRLFPPVLVRDTPHCPLLPCGLRAGSCPRAPRLFPSVPDLGRPHMLSYRLVWFQSSLRLALSRPSLSPSVSGQLG